MNTMSLSERRLYGRRVYGRAADAFDAVAWRAPGDRYVPDLPANDWSPIPEPQPEPAAPATSRPRARLSRAWLSGGWITVIAGAAAAAVMGAMMGGVLQV